MQGINIFTCCDFFKFGLIYVPINPIHICPISSLDILFRRYWLDPVHRLMIYSFLHRQKEVKIDCSSIFLSIHRAIQSTFILLETFCPTLAFLFSPSFTHTSSSQKYPSKYAKKSLYSSSYSPPKFPLNSSSPFNVQPQKYST